MKCYRNCGLDATFHSLKTGWRCNKSSSKCPVVRKRIGEANSIALKGRKQSEDTIQKRAQSLEKARKEGRWLSWNKGKKCPQISKACMGRKASSGSFDKGNVPWNKGLKKTESLEILSRDDPAYTNFQKYRNRVAVRTRKTYEEHKTEINPKNLSRGRAGTVDAYHLDHIVSVRKGFETGLPAEAIADKRNLQMIPWRDNIIKYDKVDNNILLETLLKDYT